METSISIYRAYSILYVVNLIQIFCNIFYMSVNLKAYCATFLVVLIVTIMINANKRYA